MTALALPPIPVKARFGLIYTALTLLGLGAAFTGAWLTKAHTFTRTEAVVRAPSNGAALVKAWGTPDSTVDGAQISPGLQGLTCAVYQSRRTLVCYG